MKSINKPLSNILQQFTEEEIQVLWENLQLREFMEQYNDDPVKNAEISNLKYNDSQPDTITWDVIPTAAVSAVKKYKIRFIKLATGDLFEYETTAQSYTIDNIGDGEWKVKVIPIGEYSRGESAEITFTIRSLQEKVDLFQIDMSKHSGTAAADAKFDVTATSEFYDSLSTVPDNIGYGFKIVFPDNTEQLYENFNTLTNYVLEHNVGTYTAYAYLTDNYGNHFSTMPYTCTYVFTNTMTLFEIDKDSYHSDDSVILTRKDKKAADYIASYKLYKENILIAELPSNTASIPLNGYVTSPDSANFAIAAVDMLGNEAKRVTFTAAMLPIYAADFTLSKTEHYDINQYDTLTITATAQQSAIKHYNLHFVLNSDPTVTFDRPVNTAPTSDICMFTGDPNDRFGLYTVTVTAFDENDIQCPNEHTIESFWIGDYILSVTVSVDTTTSAQDIIVTATNYQFIRELRYTMDMDPQSKPVTGNDGVYTIAKANTPGLHSIRIWCYGKAETDNPPSPKTAGPFAYNVEYPIETVSPWIEPAYNEHNDLWCYIENQSINNDVSYYEVTVDGTMIGTITPELVDGSLKGVIDTTSWTFGDHTVSVVAYQTAEIHSRTSDDYPFHVKYPIEDVTPTMTFDEPNMTITFSVPSGITVDHYVYSIGPMQHQQTSGTVDVSTLEDDFYYPVEITAYDSLGNYSHKAMETLVLPAIRHLTPEITVSNNIVSWTIDQSAEAVSYKYSVDSGSEITTANTSYDGNSLTSGTHSITVTAYNINGTASITASKTFVVRFDIEDKTPSIRYNKADSEIVLSINSATVAKYVYSGDYSGETLTGIIDTSAWTERQISIMVTAYDAAGHNSLSVTQTIELSDLRDVAPIVNYDSSIDEIEVSLPAGYTANQYRYSIDSAPEEITTNDYIVVTGLSGGQHIIEIYAVDTVNNLTSQTTTYTFSTGSTINDITVSIVDVTNN